MRSRTRDHNHNKEIQGRIKFAFQQMRAQCEKSALILLPILTFVIIII